MAHCGHWNPLGLDRKFDPKLNQDTPDSLTPCVWVERERQSIPL